MEVADKLLSDGRSICARDFAPRGRKRLAAGGEAQPVPSRRLALPALHNSPMRSKMNQVITAVSAHARAAPTVVASTLFEKGRKNYVKICVTTNSVFVLGSVSLWHESRGSTS